MGRWPHLVAAAHMRRPQLRRWRSHTQLTARQIAEESMKIAGKMCIYTNDAVTIEEL